MKKIFLFIFIASSCIGFSQSKDLFPEIDSLISNGRYKKALVELDLLEDSFRKFKTIANVHYQLDKTKLSVVFFEKALQEKEDYKTQVQLGKAYQKLKAHVKAIEIFESILEQDPDNLLIKYQLGKLYLTKRKANKAIKTFEELLVTDNTNPNYAYQKGVAYAMKKQRNSMIDSFLEAYQIDSTHVKSLYQLANSYFKLQDADSTNLFLRKGLELEPYHINLNKLMVNQTYREKKYNETLKVLEKLDTITPNELFVTNMFGRTYYNIEEHEKAKEYFEKSKEIDRTDFKTFTYLGHTEMKLKNYQKAKFNYMMATYIGVEKRDEEYYGMGHANLKMNKPKEAMAMFDKAYKENRGNHLALYQLAKTTDDYYKDKKKAYRLYDQYILQFENMDKDFTAYAKRRLKEIKKDYFLKGEKIE
ncbi:tetratricopeptide repeat protein [Pseudotenacibaculum sp. MALMAid0570]|uniref:tetratricopeptide repeat protein n=1 Tax=Pseudotenacibaculum sp. MALMAid0570 TaxID=3143938 RepID=UPI0032DFE15B